MHESWDGPDRRDTDSQAVLLGRIDENLKHLRREFSQASQSQASAYTAMLSEIKDLQGEVKDVRDIALDAQTKATLSWNSVRFVGGTIILSVIGVVLASSGIAA